MISEVYILYLFLEKISYESQIQILGDVILTHTNQCNCYRKIAIRREKLLKKNFIFPQGEVLKFVLKCLKCT